MSRAEIRSKIPRRLASLCLGLALLALGAPGAESGLIPWWFKFKATACIAGDKPLLSEIAGPVGNIPADVWQYWASKELWNTELKEGRQVVIPRQVLRELLRPFLNELVDSSVLPDQLTIQRGGTVIEAEEIKNRVVEYLTPKVQSFEGEAELKDFNLPNNIFMGDARDILLIEVVGQLKPGRVGLKYAIKGPDGKVVRQISGGCNFNLWRNVPVAARSLNPRDSVSPDLVALQRRNMAFLNGEPWNGQGGPWRVKMPIGLNQVIYTDNLEPLPTIRRGDMLTLIFIGPHVQLRAPVKAMTDGAIGGNITVLNTQTNRQVVGKVQDDKTVVVQ